MVLTAGSTSAKEVTVRLTLGHQLLLINMALGVLSWLSSVFTSWIQPMIFCSVRTLPDLITSV